MNTIRIATRESLLALAQSEIVKQQLLRKNPSLKVALKGFTTEGDRNLSDSLAKFGGKGLFLKELEQALLNNEADIAVHSLKDMPVQIEEHLTIAAMLPREDPRDALISPKYTSLEALPPGAIIGSSSLRRLCQLKKIRPDINVKSIRGNVQTRLGRLDEGEFDGLILAAAGLHRLGLHDRIACYLPTETFTPAVGQGVIGVECLKDREALLTLLSALTDPQTQLCSIAERAVSFALSASCHTPLGVYASIKNDEMTIQAFVANPETYVSIHQVVSGPASESSVLSHSLARGLIDAGALDLIA